MAAACDGTAALSSRSFGVDGDRTEGRCPRSTWARSAFGNRTPPQKLNPKVLSRVMSAARSGRSRFIDPTPTITPLSRTTARASAFCNFSRLTPSPTTSTHGAGSASERSLGAQALGLYSCGCSLGAPCVCWGRIHAVQARWSVDSRRRTDSFFHILQWRGERPLNSLELTEVGTSFAHEPIGNTTETDRRARCSTFGMSVVPRVRCHLFSMVLA
jgi:hypothetical protein